MEKHYFIKQLPTSNVNIFTKSILVLAGILFLLMQSNYAVAGDSPAPYVSDQFKSVVKKLLGRMAAEQVVQGCQKNDFLCREMAAPLGDAVQAALTSNNVKLKKSLDIFFTNSAVSGLLYTLDENSQSATSSSNTFTVQSHLLQCISANLTGQSLYNDYCMFSSSEATVFNRFGHADDEVTNRINNNQSITPAMAAEILANWATSDEIERPDLRVYFMSLGKFLDYGTDGGLFDPTLAFLSDDEDGSDNSLNISNINDQLINTSSANPSFGLWVQKNDSDFIKAISSCSMSTDAFANWQHSRDSGQWVENARRSYLKGLPIDVSPMENLLAAYSPDNCANAGGRKVLSKMRKFIRYIVSPIKLRDQLSKYGLSALVSAALIDYVKTDDELTLRRNLFQAYVYSVSQVAYRKLVMAKLSEEMETSSKRITSKTIPTIAEAKKTCEVRTINSFLGLPDKYAQQETCFSIATSTISKFQPIIASAISSDVLIHHSDELKRVLNVVLKQDITLSSSTVNIQDMDLIKQVGGALGRGNLTVVSTLLLRNGAEFLNQRLDMFANKWIDAEGQCEQTEKSSSIFRPPQSKCVLRLLVLSAYHPILDFYLQNAQGDTKDVALSIDKVLLASPAITKLPIIFNVGLGANYIRGHSSVWGNDGYSALTIIDKTGLAFYKESAENSEREFGVFAGGFLDALARTAADSGTSQRYWLLGLTAGWTRFSASFPEGIEFHVAEAMPFQLNSSDHYGEVIGCAFVVPWSTFFSAE